MLCQRSPEEAPEPVPVLSASAVLLLSSVLGLLMDIFCPSLSMAQPHQRSSFFPGLIFSRLVVSLSWGKCIERFPLLRREYPPAQARLLLSTSKTFFLPVTTTCRLGWGQSGLLLEYRNTGLQVAVDCKVGVKMIVHAYKAVIASA